MLLYIILGIIVILIAVIVSLYVICNNKLKTKSIKIDEAIEQVTTLLKDKYESLEKVNKFVKKKTKEEFLANYDDIKVDELSIYDLQNELAKYDMEVIELAEFNKDIKLDSKDIEELDNLSKINVDITAVEKYYNDNVEIYNKLLSTFPYSIMAKIMHYKKKEVFTSQKEEMFEILKK